MQSDTRMGAKREKEADYSPVPPLHLPIPTPFLSLHLGGFMKGTASRREAWDLCLRKFHCRLQHLIRVRVFVCVCV